jgi:hypothetical protein
MCTSALQTFSAWYPRDMQNIDIDKLIGFGLLVLAVAVGIIPGLAAQLPNGAMVGLFMGGIVMLKLNSTVTALGRAMGRY